MIVKAAPDPMTGRLGNESSLAEEGLHSRKQGRIFQSEPERHPQRDHRVHLGVLADVVLGRVGLSLEVRGQL
jgi:hypothetical protein